MIFLRDVETSVHILLFLPLGQFLFLCPNRCSILLIVSSFLHGSHRGLLVARNPNKVSVSISSRSFSHLSVWILPQFHHISKI